MEVRCAIFGVAGVMLCLTQELYAFVGAQDPVNPRHFRLLASDIPQPRLLERTGTLTASGLGGFVLIIAENVKTAAEDDEDPNNERHDTEAEVTEQVEVVDLTFSPKRNE